MSGAHANRHKGTTELKGLIRKTTFCLIAALFPVIASADLIIETLPGGGGMDPLGGFEMTPYNAPEDDGCAEGLGVPGTETLSSGNDGVAEIRYQGPGGLLCMQIQSPADDGLASWWQFPDHPDVLATNEVSWIELILPEGTRAFQVYIGAELPDGYLGGFVGAYDSDDNYAQTNFGGSTDIPFGADQTPGFGIYSTNSCATITRVILEPSFWWGFGNLADNQDSCTTVPEPGTLALLGLGLLGLALTRRLQVKPAVARS